MIDWLHFGLTVAGTGVLIFTVAWLLAWLMGIIE
jgi:hypothetical protein